VTRNSIDFPVIRLNDRGMTVPELLVALSISVMLIASVLGSFVSAKEFYTTNMTEQNLQRDANLILEKIIQGKVEPGGTFRLSEAVSYTQTGINNLSFKGLDGIQRRISVNMDGSAIIYTHPTDSGYIMDEALYTVPPGTDLTLRFWVPSGSQYTGVDIMIDVGLSKFTMDGRFLSGSASTMVNIRNHAS